MYNLPELTPDPSFLKERVGSLSQKIYCVFQWNTSLYGAPLFFIKERRCAEPVEVCAASAGVSVKSFNENLYSQGFDVMTL
ncbi:MAG: hypothetical protein CVV49_19475 [Spirochaetae bacterium HGW-Spirochaetae-5]|nr:MAG: hypothetical protein CVV49_19475 [Spirochaetae bacterium HGW-Spirochaetae-5]